MLEKSSIASANAASIDDDATGIYAPTRPIHATPRQRYGWRAALVLLAHALILATILLSFDFLRGIPTASPPETLDMIMVDLSEPGESAESRQTTVTPTETSQPEVTITPTRTTGNFPAEMPTIPVEPITTPELSLSESSDSTHDPHPSITPERTSTSSQRETPAPSSTQPTIPSSPTLPRVSPTAKAAPAPAANTTAQPQAASVASKNSTIQVTSPRLDPAYLHNPAPNYPALSKRNRETGTVMLLVKVNPDGSVDTVSLHNTSGYDRLDQAAMQAVARWHFVPGRRGDEAISASVIVPISFKQP